MTKHKIFQRPATREQSRIHLLEVVRTIARCPTMRHTQVHRRSQIALVRNRLDVSWQHGRIRALIRHYEGEVA